MVDQGDKKNKSTYTATDIVDYYAGLNSLQPAEAAILAQLQPQLATMTMLDLGVGGGRTTLHFAPLVQQYVGIDYSPQMVAACQHRFRSFEHPVSFEVGNAIAMSQFADHSFDLVLFSYNGIDYVSHGDRLKILAEVTRVGKPGGYFLFSSHNLQALEQNLTWKKHLTLNPLELYINLVSLGIFWGFNLSLSRQLIRDSGYLIVRDDSHLFRLRTYYIRAAHQLQQLDQDFSQVEIYPWNRQAQVSSLDDVALDTPLWLYYLCQLKG
ncbi:MAG: class I SAM-dependent methyltransferase [Leptolyngbyaceae cyanobacterium]